MTISIDFSELYELIDSLQDAATEVRQSVPSLPGQAALGVPTVANAATIFENRMETRAKSTATNWEQDATSVSEYVKDMEELEQRLKALFDKIMELFR